MGIRFIVQNFRAWNRNGWHHRCSIITATKTGARVFVAQVGGDDNVRHVIGRITGDANYPAIFNTVSDIGVREYQRMVREADGAIYEGAITRDLIARMEQEGA